MNLQQDKAWNDTDGALAALAAAEPGSAVVLLHSGRFEPRWASRSLLGRPVAWYRYTADGCSRLTLAAGATGDFHLPPIDLTADLWADLRRLLHHPDLPGRWIGYLSYDLGRLIEPDKLARPVASAWPLVELGYCPQVELFTLPSTAITSPGLGAVVDRPAVGTCTKLRSDFTRPAYEQAVGRVIEHIAAGDVFQVNLAQRFTARYTGSSRALYAKLASVSPAWYGAYLEFEPIGPSEPTSSIGATNDAAAGGRVGGPVQRAILSTSPELFLQVTGRHVITRPIKGTRPFHAGRREDAATDDRDYLALKRSAKDAAELAMIVDLMRNDLGRVCAYGSVRVTEPRAIETHPTVYHTTATIEGDLAESNDLVDLLRAVLPGGSVTGAPKVRAMQIIDALEPVRRGPYCGCIGFLSRDELCLNMAIRTMFLERVGQTVGSNERSAWAMSFSVGGGIVADSDPAAEYDETLTKAQALLRALGPGQADQAS